MRAIKEHGDCIIYHGDEEYFLRPSFSAMMQIGEPKEIVQAFADVHDDSTIKLINDLVMTCGRVPEWSADYFNKHGAVKKSLMAAMDVIQACCERDVTPLIGYLKESKRSDRFMMWVKGAMDHHQIIIIASTLLQHGIIGKAKIRIPQRAATTGKKTDEFHGVEYINSARAHFGMTREDAASLTMTEFVLLLNAKYPNQKGLTKEEYDAGKAEALRQREMRIEAQRIKREIANGK